MKPIYLDYNATTPLHPRVASAMAPFLTSFFGNPSSSHYYGIQAKKIVEECRAKVASLLGCEAEEITFTSGGSESNNYAIKGCTLHLQNTQGRNHVITTKVEHPSVMEVCRYLEANHGIRVTYLDVDKYGMIDIEDLKSHLNEKTALVTIMHANNEIGTLQPIYKVSQVLRDFKTRTGIHVYLHTDAAQSIGKIWTKVYSTSEQILDHDLRHVDMISICSHKFYGPKGIGALFVRKGLGITLQKQIHGAGHERNHRAGTENVLEIVGLASSCEISALELEERIDNTRRLRDMLYDGLRAELGEDYIRINGHPTERLPNTLSISFPRVEANTLLDEIGEKVAASAGAACHSDDIEMSYVLKAIGLPVEIAMGTIRFSTGMLLTEHEVNEAIKIISNAVKRLRPEQESEMEQIFDDEACDLNSLRLTTTTHGLGCGCKIRPQTLEVILKSLPRQKTQNSHNILVGTETADDAAVVRVRDDLAIVSTLDFFTPIVDDAYEFGYIAATNALSDVYAMGGVPVTALNIVCFPVRRLPLKVLQEILRGAQACCNEAQVDIVGGHSVDDNELKFGMSVTGTIHPEKIWKNIGGAEGDVLILTKGIGVGIIMTGVKRGLVSSDSETGKSARKTMMELNKNAYEILVKYNVHACTDITGFGLIGHIKEMLTDSSLSVIIDSKRIPIIEGVHELVALGAVPGGTVNNLQSVASNTYYDSTITETTKIILNDAQTSGGLCAAVSKQDAEQILKSLPSARIIGKFVAKQEKSIIVQ